MIIIVEGIDRVGKTTLCNMLQKHTNFPIYKHNSYRFDYSKMDNLNETDKMLQLLDLYSILNGNVIFDRFHWSDCVYGIIDRGYNFNIAFDNEAKIDKKLRELDAIIIYVLPTDIEASSLEHGKDLAEHKIMMDTCFVLSKIKKYKCTYLSLEETVKEVIYECGL